MNQAINPDDSYDLYRQAHLSGQMTAAQAAQHAEGGELHVQPAAVTDAGERLRAKVQALDDELDRYNLPAALRGIWNMLRTSLLGQPPATPTRECKCGGPMLPSPDGMKCIRCDAAGVREVNRG